MLVKFRILFSIKLFLFNWNVINIFILNQKQYRIFIELLFSKELKNMHAILLSILEIFIFYGETLQQIN